MVKKLIVEDYDVSKILYSQKVNLRFFRFIQIIQAWFFLIS